MSNLKIGDVVSVKTDSGNWVCSKAYSVMTRNDRFWIYSGADESPDLSATISQENVEWVRGIHPSLQETTTAIDDVNDDSFKEKLKELIMQAMDNGGTLEMPESKLVGEEYTVYFDLNLKLKSVEHGDMLMTYGKSED